MGMKVCKKGWEYAQIIDGEGNVDVCPWGPNSIGPIGKLTEQSMYEIWHGEKVQKFRESLIDGSYRYCRGGICPWIANGTIEEHLEEYDDVLEYPVDLSISYENTCNYVCRCCRDNATIRCLPPPDENKLQKINNELKQFIGNVYHIGANGRGELFASPHILEILGSWKPAKPTEEIMVDLETNGSLFNEKNWEKIKNLGQYHLHVSITVMSFDDTTYKFLSGTRMSVQNVIDNLFFVRGLREKGIINYFELATVMQERNFREMPEFARRCIEEFGADCFRLRPFFPYNEYQDTVTKWFYDVRNPHHPYYEEYVEMMKDPIFENEKVFKWAGNDLSSQREYPFYKEAMNFEVIKYFATDEQIGSKLTQYFIKEGIDCLSVYGLSQIGQAFLHVLGKTVIMVDRIIDKNLCGYTHGDKIVEKVQDLPQEYSLPIIVTAPFYFDEIKAALMKQIEKPCIYNVKDIIYAIECK